MRYSREQNMGRLMLMIVLTVFVYGCNNSNKWQDTQASLSEAPQEDLLPPSEEATSSSQQPARILAGATQIGGMQVTGSVSISNETTNVKSAGLYGKIEILNN